MSQRPVRGINEGYRGNKTRGPHRTPNNRKSHGGSRGGGSHGGPMNNGGIRPSSYYHPQYGNHGDHHGGYTPPLRVSNIILAIY